MRNTCRALRGHCFSPPKGSTRENRGQRGDQARPEARMSCPSLSRAPSLSSFAAARRESMHRLRLASSLHRADSSHCRPNQKEAGQRRARKAPPPGHRAPQGQPGYFPLHRHHWRNRRRPPPTANAGFRPRPEWCCRPAPRASALIPSKGARRMSRADGPPRPRLPPNSPLAGLASRQYRARSSHRRVRFLRCLFGPARAARH
mmetsp:Transcript_25556/g.47649  ORF Transcript_25556/g.47649 Transcript_25556/m.47649 type:complete len:203 (+) Transcript_25556:611-1219(+)